MRLFCKAPLGAPALLIAAALLALAPRGGAVSPARSVAVATEHPAATRAALDVLAKGGNAVDAIATAALVAGVVNPTSSGIGGGGFALVLAAGESAPRVLDFRETAPARLDAKALALRPLGPADRGHLVGVPGEVAGLHALVTRFGRRPWAEIVAPAERMARLGFVVERHLAESLDGKVRAAISADRGLADVYLPRGQPAKQGLRLKNPKLARALARIANEGPRAFYEGTMAAGMVAAVQGSGGTLALDDLRAYRPIERAPLAFRWAGCELFSVPPPSAGGMLLAQTVGMFSPEELRQLGRDTGAYQHLLAEAFRSALADRFRFVGDPAFVPVDVARLLAPERLARRRRGLAIDRTHALPRFLVEEHGTHHLAVADADGMVVSLTTTVNRAFGARLSAEDSGIVLNDELDDFSLPPDSAGYGVAAYPNAPRPGARPVSSMTPVIARCGGETALALGGSGGMTIATNVTQLAIARLAFGLSPAELVRERRFYVMSGSTTLQLEPGAPAALIADLRRRGEVVGETSSKSAVQVLARENGVWSAAADPRKFGSAATRPARKTTASEASPR